MKKDKNDFRENNLETIVMSDDNLQEILSMQAALGRTVKGWDLGKNMLGASMTSSDSQQNEDFSATQCVNCGLVLSSEFFSSGCPNCGCKDTKNWNEKIVKLETIDKDNATGKTSKHTGRFVVVNSSQH